MEDITVETQRLDHLGIVAGICHEIGLIEIIDERIGKTDRKVSVGIAVQAMVLNALGFVGRPLYLTPEYFENKPLDRLLRPGITAEDLNDDSLGRALDALFEAGLTELFAKIASHALDVFGIEYRFAHLDTTSFSVVGAYPEKENPPPEKTNNLSGVENPLLEVTSTQGESNEPSAVRITYGYSKDHRPDLKQVMLEMICAHRSSLPLWLKALDGNSSDTTSFPKAVNAYVEQLKGAPEPYFVYDSAGYSAANVAILASRKWITRVPERIGEAADLCREYPIEAMRASALPGYRYAEVMSYYGGIPQRWLVVYSEAAYQREGETLRRRIEAERRQAEKAAERLPEAPDVETARAQVAAMEARWRSHRWEGEIEEVGHYDKPGRPRSDQAPDRVTYQAVGSVVPDAERVEAQRATLGRFVLATDELDDEALPAEAILSTYKGQGASVERGFRFLKDPLFFAGSLFLKSAKRIMALLMVMGLSLLIYALAEHRLREELKRREETVPDAKGKPTQRPTMRRIFQMFEGIDVLKGHARIPERGSAMPRGERESGGDEPRTRAGCGERVLNLTPLHLRILDYFGPHVKKCYIDTY